MMGKMKLSDYDYELPRELIAQNPIWPRDRAKLMVVNRQAGTLEPAVVRGLADWLSPQDVLIINQTKVFPARLLGQKAGGGKVEILLLSEEQGEVWEALSKPGLKVGAKVVFKGLKGVVTKGNNQEGVLEIKFQITNIKYQTVRGAIEKIGKVPLPPYIKSDTSQVRLKKQYQSLFAKEWGSAAAPTASFHFSRGLIKTLKQKGVTFVPVVLHVGLGTFQPVTSENWKKGLLHREKFMISRPSATKIEAAKYEGKRIIALGTTAMRALESAAYMEGGRLKLATGWQTTRLFIKPPYQFKVVNSLITNFHLPQSSLLMLVTAFTSRPNGKQDFETFKTSLVGQAYAKAKVENWRFYSFGDAMWIV